ncbi:lytic transglycosylase domain-containing protein [Streptacidiphilus melanogenes]|uniref:lytic transglycosylase domain-containing protein n=1 Tax=Streptacidiphilus melanogenes TaxID=411235 RepID=UPI000693FF64|nr:lytic transglycosylase domain-containing protein [Streptacidiphilus melanogenes]
MNTHRPHRRTIGPAKHRARPDRARLWCTAASLAGAVVLAAVVGQPAPTAAAAATPAATHATSATGDGGPLDLVLPPTPTGSPGASSPDAAPGTGGVTIPAGSGIPSVVWDAYRSAQRSVTASDPGCHLDWTVLAAVGEVESGQADGGNVTADGTTRSPILGPALDGTNGNAAVPAPGGGWARAEGPMQFLPSTWASWRVDGNRDGVADPNNVYDAALAAGHYLCADGRDLGRTADLDAAILSYNHSPAYLATVTAWISYYRSSPTVPTASSTIPPSDTPGAPGTPTATTPGSTKATPPASTSPGAGPSRSAGGSPTPSAGTGTGSTQPTTTSSASPTPSGTVSVPPCPGPSGPSPTASAPPSSASPSSASPSSSPTGNPPTCSATPTPDPSGSAGTAPATGSARPAPIAA